MPPVSQGRKLGRLRVGILIKWCLSSLSLLLSKNKKLKALLSLPMNKTHGMNCIQCKNYFCSIESCPFFRHVIVAHQVYKVSARHVFHHHVEITVILECIKKLQIERKIIRMIFATLGFHIKPNKNTTVICK